MIKSLILEELNFIKEYYHSENADSQYYPKVDMKTEDVFNLIEYQDNNFDLYPGYDPDLEDSENEYDLEYYFDTKDIAYQAANGVLEMFESLESPILIYRTITVKSLDDINHEDLGESWSLYKESALSFGSRIRANILLEAKTEHDNVDWKKAVKLFFVFSGGFTDEDEDELPIIDSSKLFDIQVHKI